MGYAFLEKLLTPGVRAAQTANESEALWTRPGINRDFTRFTDSEAAFIGARDSFYMASVSESGWPYVQHRGGPVGFVRVLDETTLGFADYAGNRQYISVGNVATDDRVALILVDYPHRTRLKILGHLRAHDIAAEPGLAARLAVPGYRARVERAFTLRLEAFDWNCPQHITPRFTGPEIEEAIAPLRARLEALEEQNATLREAAAAASNDAPADRPT